ncbi:hypothetical protein PM082_021616 [Marasmius tenuissimus]|nr:hypothetical protein PM082_021616 [Marasmius tenuissimus]
MSITLLHPCIDPIILLGRLWVKSSHARGVSLISPTTFLDILPLLPDAPYRLCESGDIKILYTPHFSTASIATCLSSPVTPMVFSISEHIPLPACSTTVGRDGDASTFSQL